MFFYSNPLFFIDRLVSLTSAKLSNYYYAKLLFKTKLISFKYLNYSETGIWAPRSSLFYRKFDPKSVPVLNTMLEDVKTRAKLTSL